MKLIEAQKYLGIKADDKWGTQSYNAVAEGLEDSVMRRKLLMLELTPHFKLIELIYSDTAISRGNPNIPDAEILKNLVYLCRTILEPVRENFGPVRVTSGYRYFTPKSQHGKGEAADFEVTGISNKNVAEWIVKNLRFDQLILEAWNKNDPNAGWIHCSSKRDRARGIVLRTPTGRAPYFPGLG